MAIGDITGTIDSDGASGSDSGEFGGNNILHVHGSVYIGARGSFWSDPGFVRTIGIQDDGTTDGAIDNYALNRDGGCRYIIRISQNVYAVTYLDEMDDVWIETFGVNDNGTITANIAEHNPVGSVSQQASPIFHIAGNVYAIVHTNWQGSRIQTVTIQDNGTITGNIDSHTFDAAGGWFYCMIPVAGEVYAIVCHNGNIILRTVGIQDNGTITGSIDTHIIGPGNSFQDILPIAGNVYAIAYSDNNDDGIMETFDILDNGTITGSIDTHTFESERAANPTIAHVAENAYAVAYRNEQIGPNRGGWINTIGIQDNGTITGNIDDYMFHLTASYPQIFHVANNVFAARYTTGLHTVGITRSDAAAARHRFTGGMMHRPVH